MGSKIAKCFFIKKLLKITECKASTVRVFLQEEKKSMIQFHSSLVLIENRKLVRFSGNKHFMRDVSIHSAAKVLVLLFSWLVCFPTLVLLFDCSVALD